jgi:uncharacterized protein (DUF1330 family)
MKGYLIANVDVADEAGYESYRSQTGAVVERHGGRFLVRGGALDVLEGDPGIARLVVLEFPSVEAAHAFYASADYQAILPLRTAYAEASLFIVEGAPDEGPA